MKRLGDRQEKAVSDYREQRSEARERGEAARGLESPTASQAVLKTSKEAIQSKLAEARGLLSKLTAEEKARLAALETMVFFYDDISHVGMYVGNGMMIHAPKPGAYVREESIYYIPIPGSVRPG